MSLLLLAMKEPLTEVSASLAFSGLSYCTMAHQRCRSTPRRTTYHAQLGVNRLITTILEVMKEKVQNTSLHTGNNVTELHLTLLH